MKYYWFQWLEIFESQTSRVTNAHYSLTNQGHHLVLLLFELNKTEDS